jgi:hypothetical protein
MSEFNEKYFSLSEEKKHFIDNQIDMIYQEEHTKFGTTIAPKKFDYGAYKKKLLNFKSVWTDEEVGNMENAIKNICVWEIKHNQRSPIYQQTLKFIFQL